MPVTVMNMARLLFIHLGAGAGGWGAITSAATDRDCPCSILARPQVQLKLDTARWMAHTLDWGVLSTLSTRNGLEGKPFGNPYSFVDGTCLNATGVPYFYGSFLDQSLKDSLEDASASLTLSEAGISVNCAADGPLKSCRLVGFGDPENPLCARLTLSGELVVLEDDSSDEYQWAYSALMERHNSMEHWPADHEWAIFKLEIHDIWLIDFFGGATILNVDDYLAYEFATVEDARLL